MDSKKFGTIFNNDINNILYGGAPDWTADDYKHCVRCLLGTKPGVLAQNVGLPDPVIYRSREATILSKYLGEVVQSLWPSREDIGEEQSNEARVLENILSEGTDPLALTIDACCEAGVAIVASYRMNAEDYYQKELDLSEFGRAHRHLSIPGANCLDPARPEVYAHRLDIFREVANSYDIDGIELDFRRWFHMISNPRDNHPVLTRMVHDVRALLDDAAAAKGRGRMILGARVGAMLDGTFRREDFPGACGVAENPSCRDLGLDVKAWVEAADVDYISPSLFWGRLPGGIPRTGEFARLARDTACGVYPTVFPLASWMEEGPDMGPVEADDPARLRRYRDDLCRAALKCYEEGADGISTFNWMPHEQPGMMHSLKHRANWGMGAKKVQMVVHTLLGDPERLREYMHRTEVLPEEESVL